MPPPAATTTAVTLTVEGVRVESEANARAGHWAARHRRNRAQQDLILCALAGRDKAGFWAAHRLRVTFTRIMGRRGREMDSDNLVGAMKHCRDAVARWLDTDDVSPWWEWVVNPVQERGSDYGVRITLEPIGG